MPLNKETKPNQIIQLIMNSIKKSIFGQPMILSANPYKFHSNYNNELNS